MGNPPSDKYPTTVMRVPNLVELLARLRDPGLRNPITVLHGRVEGEGEWVTANAAARMQRENIKAVGPEAASFSALVEHAARLGAKIVFLGEVRRAEDGRALRNAASLGIHPVAYLTMRTRAEAQDLLTVIGPWEKYDIVLLSSEGQASNTPPR